MDVKVKLINKIQPEREKLMEQRMGRSRILCSLQSIS